MGFHFQNGEHFLEYFWFYLLTIVDTKKRYLEFLFICSIFVFTNSVVKLQHVLFANEPFLRKMLVSFFSWNIPLYSENNPVVKLCKVLEMELKTYTPVGPKFVFVKIKFIVLHCIQHDFIRLISFDMISTTRTQ